MAGRNRRRIAWYVLAALALLCAGLLLRRAAGQVPQQAAALQASLVASAALSQDQTGYARADGSRTLVFPADHGPHPEYLTEWWYYTGNLRTGSGEHFGYQLTFFRRALQPPGAGEPPRSSSWATEQVYLAHFALTDVSAGSHRAVERSARGAAGLAGAEATPYRVWLDDWSVAGADDGSLRLVAATEQFSLTLALLPARGPVLQGDAGYSRKGAEPGNASYYYSLTRLETKGVVRSGGRDYAAAGLSWMDHEFSTNALSPGLAGWDWFSLQLDGGSELMLYQLRDASGNGSPFSGGTYVATDGRTRTLGPADFVLGVTGQWRSPHNGAEYPSGWSISVPSAGLELTVQPYLADQENNLSYSYWEGCVSVTGTREGVTTDGSGFAELTGYAGSLGDQF